jgi:hypothetical protein
MNNTPVAEEPYLCIFCKKPIADLNAAKENEYGEYLCCFQCELNKAQNDAEAAYERHYERLLNDQC